MVSFTGDEMHMEKGLIFDIKRFAIHDGPGIRTTVFFKGCPLSCWWCHNPESQSPSPELMVRPTRCIEGCRECCSCCHVQAISKGNGIVVEREKCDVCMACVETCPSEALQMVGRVARVEELIAEIEKDIVFFDESKGGVTFSGGEPLMQPTFLASLLRACKKRGIHTSLDTSGHAPFHTIEGILDTVDLFIYDIKLLDEESHKMYTGVSNRLILKNLEKLTKLHDDVEVRVPLIPHITDTEENISSLPMFLSSLDKVRNVVLLPYHNSAKKKYEGLDRENRMGNTPTSPTEEIDRIKKRFTECGFGVKIGG
jgi:pyruvate formate lyase activating enzyme